MPHTDEKHLLMLLPLPSLLFGHLIVCVLNEVVILLTLRILVLLHQRPLMMRGGVG